MPQEKCTQSIVQPRLQVEQINTMRIFGIILILVLVSVLPTWPYSSRWGYYPSGGLGLVVVIILLLLLFGII